MADCVIECPHCLHDVDLEDCAVFCNVDLSCGHVYGVMATIIDGTECVMLGCPDCLYVFHSEFEYSFDHGMLKLFDEDRIVREVHLTVMEESQCC